MSARWPTKQTEPEKKDDLVLTPGGRRSSSKVHKVEVGQHVEVQDGHMKVVHTESGKVVADLGTVGQAVAKNARAGGPMKKAGRPKAGK